MKRSEIAVIILIAAISVGIAYLIADAVIGRPSSEAVKVKTTSEIKPDVVEPDASVFNKDAINPTVEVVIGDE